MATCSGNIDVMCLGILVTDVLGKPVEKMPDWRQLIVVDHMELQIGGCATNSATGLAKLGVKTAAMGKVGIDILGDFILRHLESVGVDIRGVRRDDRKNTSFTFVMIAKDGERAFFHYPGVNGILSYEDVDFSLIGDSKILHVAGSFVMPALDGEPTARLMRNARSMGVTTCLDTVWNGEIDQLATLKPSLPHLDYFLPSIDEARLMTSQEDPRDVAQFFLDMGVGTVGLKMGPEGCYVRNESEEVRLPAFRVTPVDTSGAGDAFVAGFLTGVVKGWDLEESAKLGSAMGALCCTQIGTTAGLRSLDETVEFMRTAQTY